MIAQLHPNTRSLRVVTKLGDPLLQLGDLFLDAVHSRLGLRPAFVQHRIRGLRLCFIEQRIGGTGQLGKLDRLGAGGLMPCLRWRTAQRRQAAFGCMEKQRNRAEFLSVDRGDNATGHKNCSNDATTMKKIRLHE